ncbi:MAG: dihydrolipoamide acetyltransferase family protein [Candidatus Hodarchaeales archaeon]|jgi:pyruvate dehydrogenase E2 component (dihydrolipoamide acetyltransferase)
MKFEFKFADPGEGVHEGELLQWHVQPGDQIENEQLLAEVMTEKVTVELASPVVGKLISLEYEIGDIITVGSTMLIIDTSETSLKKSDKSFVELSDKIEKDDSLFTASTPFNHVLTDKKSMNIVNKKPLAPPSIRKQAREQNIDLKAIIGSGPAGRITRKDFDEYRDLRENMVIPKTHEKPVISRKDEIKPLRGLRRNIAKAMRKSKDTAAHYTYFEEVDMSSLDSMKNKSKSLAEERGIKISYLPLVIKCLIPALRKFPIFNSSLNDENGEIVIKGDINIGIAVNTDEGLVVPVVKNVDQKNIWELAQEISDLAQKARDGELKLNDVKGGTFTVTSVGNLGGFAATPIIRWPEVAILGLMRNKLRPVVIEQHGKPEIAIRPVMMLSLTIDHRVIDGAVGAMFTNELVRYLENPAILLLEENY